MMARGLNKVMLIGNLGADPEIKYSPSGTPIANLRLATTDRRRNKDGEWEEQTEWHRIVMFGKQAEVCKDYLKKGTKLFIEGRLQTRSWDDQGGQKHYMTEIVGSQMVMLDSRGQDSPTQSGSRRSSGGGYKDAPPDDLPEPEDGLPF
jgi:single-strand DNA-binding protein